MEENKKTAPKLQGVKKELTKEEKKALLTKRWFGIVLVIDILLMLFLLYEILAIFL